MDARLAWFRLSITTAKRPAWSVQLIKKYFMKCQTAGRQRLIYDWFGHDRSLQLAEIYGPVYLNYCRRFLANVNSRYMLSPVRLSSVCLPSVTFVRPTQAVQIFGNISTALGTLAIH